MGKQWICEMAHEVASKCLQIFGGYGYSQESEISRIYAESTVMSILAGSSEVVKLIVSRGIGLSSARYGYLSNKLCFFMRRYKVLLAMRRMAAAYLRHPWH